LAACPASRWGTPRIGKTLSEVLHNDLDAQANVRPQLNAAAERVEAAHDATTRNLIERILDDEEQHLDGLRTEVELYEKLGEPLYMANRLR
jgi:bacterioferritin